MVEKLYIQGGFVCLARAIQESAIWRDDPHILKLFLYLIMEARFSEDAKKYPNFQVNRGELITSLSTIAENNEYVDGKTVRRWSRAKVSRMLQTLKDQDYIEIIADTYGTHINVCNYNTYNDPETYRANSDEMDAKRPCNDGGHNSKNGKKVVIKETTGITPSSKPKIVKEVSQDCIDKMTARYPKYDIPANLEAFYDYIEANGKKYTNYDAAFRNRMSNDFPKIMKAGILNKANQHASDADEQIKRALEKHNQSGNNLLGGCK